MCSVRNLAMLATVILLAAGIGVPHPAQGMEAPPGVPNLLDPDVQTQFRVLLETQFGGDPNFPVVVLVNVAGVSPRMLLLIIDARNGKSTWSLQEDAPIFVLLSDSPTTRQAFLDKGFASTGKPSGTFLSAGTEETSQLLLHLQEGHRRCIGHGRLIPATWTGR